jgi:hypothetical protein
MEMPRSQHDETEDIAVMVDSGWMNDAATSMERRLARPTTSLQVAAAGDVASEALLLALSAVHIDIAWHAGAMSAEAAMEDLHREIDKTINRCNESPRTGSLEAVDRTQSRRTTMSHRTTSCG